MVRREGSSSRLRSRHGLVSGRRRRRCRRRQRAARVADINRTRLARDGRFEVSEGDAEGIPESFNKRPSVGQPLQYRKSGEEVRRRDLTPTEQAA